MRIDEVHRRITGAVSSQDQYGKNSGIINGPSHRKRESGYFPTRVFPAFLQVSRGSHDDQASGENNQVSSVTAHFKYRSVGEDGQRKMCIRDRIKAIKKIAAPIRVELAQFRELAAFSQFGSELDADTKEKLAQGERIREVLKQPQYQPMGVEYQVIIIYAATKKYLLDIPVDEILRFEKELFEFVDTKYPELPEAIRREKALSPELEEKLAKAVSEFKEQFELCLLYTSSTLRRRA